MSIESTNRIFNESKIFSKKLNFLVGELENEKKRNKKRAINCFIKKQSGNWVENGCDKCGGGMSKNIYDFQRENRRGGKTICSKCSKLEDIKSLKKL